jgi:uncharacterized NAD(P)/FAD-binding protein YdhS
MRTVAVIGGGFTGGAVAWNLARASRAVDTRIVVFEPRARLGAGLAYDTIDAVHRINVPAAKMSLDPGDPEDFLRWIAETNYVATDAGALTSDGGIFPRRAAFGAYAWSRIEPYIASGAIEHITERVTKVEPSGARWRLTSQGGATVDADCVVVATTHPSPAAPRLLSSMLEGHPRFIADATVPDALANIRKSDAVLVVGNGLTSADVIASLIDRGHTGAITSVSRRGLRSRGHAPRPQDPHGDFLTRPVRSARLLTRRIRDAIEQAGHFGVSWHAVIDAVRAQAGTIWGNLPLAERQRVVRHLRAFWDVHRFRIAPQVENALETATAAGQLETLAASVAAVSYNGQRIRMALRRAHGAGTLIRDFDAVVVTTGPAHGAIFDSQDYLSELAFGGIVTKDPTGLGLGCDEHSRLLDRDGRPVPGLYVAGPLARGTFGELMGLPQVSEHASSVAFEAAAFLSRNAAAGDAA